MVVAARCDAGASSSGRALPRPCSISAPTISSVSSIRLLLLLLLLLLLP